MKTITSLILLFFMLTSQAYAITGVPDSRHWVPAGYGGGGTFSVIVPDHFTAGKYYAIPDVNAPYVSTNSGGLWSFLSTVGGVNSGYLITQTSAFVQSVNNPLLMYALDSQTQGGIQKSIDGGQTWVKKAVARGNKPYRQIAMDPTDDNKVYTISGGNVIRTTDGETWSTYITRPFASRAAAYTSSSSCTNAGGSWFASTCIINPRFLYVDAVHNDLWMGSSRQGMVKYDMDTDTQTYVDLVGTNAMFNLDFATYRDGSNVENFCVTAGHKIACTADFSTWTYTEQTTSQSTYYIKRFGVKRKADTTLSFVISRNTTSSEFTVTNQYSTDSGATWTNVGISKSLAMNPTNAYNAGGRYYSIVPSPNNDTDWFISTDWTIFKSVNGGANFTESVTGGQNIVSNNVAVSPNGRIFLVSMDVGIQYSDDFGVTWIAGTPSTAKGQGYSTNSVTDYGGHYWRVLTLGSEADWDAGNGTVIVSAYMYSNPVSLKNVNYVLKSVDNGETWTRSNNGLPTTPLFGDAIWGCSQGCGYARSLGASADGSVLYVGMDGQNGSVTGGLFRSDDLGETWQRQWPSTPNRVYNGIAVDPTDSTGNTVLFGTFRYNMYRLTKITAENAEITGTGATRTGTLNKKNQALNPVFTSIGGEIFQPVSFGSSTLSSNLGGTGTYNGSTGAYSLTFASAPTTTAVTYQYRSYVGDSNGPRDYVQEVVYDSKGHPYALSQNVGAEIYKSITTSFGNANGAYGTWRLMKHFSDNGLPDGIVIDPNDDNRIFVSIAEGNVSNRKIYVTPNAQNHTSADWYDITGDFPVVGGCRGLAVNPNEGTRGFLYCAANGGGMYKLDLADTPGSNPGIFIVGGN